MYTGPRLDDCIATLTRIPEAVLGDYTICHTVSVDGKLQWARHRQATREEDLTYCLLGILDVSMTIRYGDGKEKSWVRLLKKLGSRGSNASDQKRHGLAQPHCAELVLESPDEVVMSRAGLHPLAIELRDHARRIRLLRKSIKDVPTFLEEMPNDLETFAHALRGLEKDRQSNTNFHVDNATLQRCFVIFRRAGDRIRSALHEFEVVIKNSGENVSADEREFILFYNEADAVRTSLALAYQLYVDARRKADTALIYRMLAGDGLSPLQKFDTTPAVHPSFTDMPARCNFEAVGRYSPASQYQPRPKGANRGWRLRISPWFTSRVWEASLHFGLNLRTSNLVPHDALIFEACRDGDLAWVKTLFAEGKASPFDHAEKPQARGTSVLAQAAGSGNLELCRYLVDLAGFPIRSHDSEDPLSNYALRRELEVESPDALQMYRLLLSDPERDYDLDNLIHRAYPWHWYQCPSPSCLSLIKERSPARIEDLPWPTQFQLAIDISDFRYPSLPPIFLEMLGTQCVDSRIAAAQDVFGRTALHMVAEECTIYRPEGGLTASWPDVVQDLIISGADLHTLTYFERTPLMCSWRGGREFGATTVTMQRWIALLEKAGVDLEAYGEVEAFIFRYLYRSGFDEMPLVRVRSFTFGPRVRDWTTDEQRKRVVALHTLDHPPGAWKTFDEFKSNTICWDPEQEEHVEPWPWRKGGEVTLRSGLDNDRDERDIHDESLDHDALAAGIKRKAAPSATKL